MDSSFEYPQIVVSFPIEEVVSGLRSHPGIAGEGSFVSQDQEETSTKLSNRRGAVVGTPKRGGCNRTFPIISQHNCERNLA